MKNDTTTVDTVTTEACIGQLDENYYLMGGRMTLMVVEEVKGNFPGGTKGNFPSGGSFLQKSFDKICLKAVIAFFPICGLWSGDRRNHRKGKLKLFDLQGGPPPNTLPY